MPALYAPNPPFATTGCCHPTRTAPALLLQLPLFGQKLFWPFAPLFLFVGVGHGCRVMLRFLLTLLCFSLLFLYVSLRLFCNFFLFAVHWLLLFMAESGSGSGFFCFGFWAWDSGTCCVLCVLTGLLSLLGCWPQAQNCAIFLSPIKSYGRWRVSLRVLRLLHFFKFLG